MSAFYSDDHKYLAENLIRFCFIKKDETLSKAEEILNNFVTNKDINESNAKNVPYESSTR